MIHIIITSYKEPKATVRAVKSFLRQKIKEEFKIIVVDPFPEVEEYLNKEIKSKNVEFFLDPGEGKNYAMNILFDRYLSENTKDILIFTDGDVFVSENTVSEIMEKFKDKKVGCVTGRPVSVDSRKKRMGYWSKVLYSAIHNVRIRLDRDKKFFQCSGYLFAIRNGLIAGIPEEVPEDCIIPYLIWKKGYRVAYAGNAEVYVKYPDNWKDWVNQRIRTIKAHENIPKAAPDMPRTKSFLNELKEGVRYTLGHPSSLREYLWVMQLYFARLYIYGKSFWDIRRKRVFNPQWRDTEIKSTNTLD